MECGIIFVVVPFVVVVVPISVGVGDVSVLSVLRGWLSAACHCTVKGCSIRLEGHSYRIRYGMLCKCGGGAIISVPDVELRVKWDNVIRLIASVKLSPGEDRDHAVFQVDRMIWVRL